MVGTLVKLSMHNDGNGFSIFHNNTVIVLISKKFIQKLKQSMSKGYVIGKYPAAVHSYQIYQMSHSPLLALDSNGRMQGTPDKYYYCFVDGCCDFFVTDSRTERDPDEKEMITEEQMSELLNWLNDGSGRIKFVVSSVLFFPDTKKENEDKWGGYKAQRDQIISHIREFHINKVVFLSGDVHCSMSAELDMSADGDDPLKIYSVISSAFYWPYPHMKRRKFKLSGSVASEQDDDAYRLGKVSEVYSGDDFSRVKVSHEQMTTTQCIRA